MSKISWTDDFKVIMTSSINLISYTVLDKNKNRVKDWAKLESTVIVLTKNNKKLNQIKIVEVHIFTFEA